MRLTDWDPFVSCSGCLYNQDVCTASIDIKTFIGSKGSYWCLSGSRLRVADTPTGNLLDESAFPFNCPNFVNALALAGDTLYVATDQITGGAETRYGLAAIDTVAKQFTAFDPTITGGSIEHIFVNGDYIFILGDFTSVNGQARHHAASLDRFTGNLGDWDPQAEGRITSVAASDSSVFMAGVPRRILFKQKGSLAETRTGPWESCPVMLSTESSASYQWFVDGGAIPGATEKTYEVVKAGVYSVQVTNAEGDYSSSAPMPVECGVELVPKIYGESLACLNPGAHLSTDAYVAYQWRKDGADIAGATAREYIAQSSGIYEVAVTEADNDHKLSMGHPVTISFPVIQGQGGSPNCTPVEISTGAFSTYQWYRNGAPIPQATGQSFYAAAPGTYSVRITSETGCSQYSAAYIAYNPPSSPSISGANSACVSTILSTGPYSAYQWNLDGNPISGATAQNCIAVASGSYTVTVWGPENCQSTSPPKAVTIHPNPTPTVEGPSTGCNSVTLMTQEFSSYQWYRYGALVSGATARTYVATQYGEYSVAVTDSFSCSWMSPAKSVSVNYGSTPDIYGSSVACGSISLYTNDYFSSYQWNLGGTPIAGATAMSYTTYTSNIEH